MAYTMDDVIYNESKRSVLFYDPNLYWKAYIWDGRFIPLAFRCRSKHEAMAIAAEKIRELNEKGDCKPYEGKPLVD